MTDFDRKLSFGTCGEDVVCAFLRKQGFYVTRTSFIKEPRRGGPRMTSDIDSIVLPDLQAHRNGETRWIEVKTKSIDVFYSITQEHRQGVDESHFDAYLRSQAQSGIEGHLGFLVLTPEPIKLRMASLSKLDQYKQAHRGMVYWPVEIFESFEIRDRELVSLAPKPQAPTTTHAWSRPIPGAIRQQGFFDFGRPDSRCF